MHARWLHTSLGPALVCAIAAPALRAQDELSYGKAADVGMSRAILDAGAALFEEAVERDDLRGAVVLVARRGKIVLHQAYGWRDLEKTEPMARDSLFRMASNTKAVVAAAVMKLVDDRKLGLDDETHSHLPSYRSERGRGITIRQLLSHTSGLRIKPIFLKPLIQRSEEHPDAPSLQVEVARFGAIGAAKPPGTSYSYSNAGYNTLGALVEVASRKPLKVYLRERIYEPLGMADSSNHEPDADHARMSAIFRRARGARGDRGGRPGGEGAARWRVGWKPGDKPDYPFPRASGGMISTARDYAVFFQMILNGGSYGGVRILSEDAVKAMTSPQTKGIYSAEELRTRASFYGFGLTVTTDGVLSHGGSDGTWGWIDSRRKMIGLVFTQSPGGRNPRNQFQRVVHAACYDGR